VTGWVVDSASATDIAKIVLDLAGDAGRRQQASEAAPAFVRQKFGLARMIHETLQVYALGDDAPETAR
jgi:hypothetical protein